MEIFKSCIQKTIIAVCALSCIASAGYSQTRKSTLPPLKTNEAKLRDFQERQLLESPLIVMEGPIEAETYLVGPGDEMLVSIGGISPALEIPITVLPEGVVSIPDKGEISVKGMTLKDARNKIILLLQDLYPDSDIAVTLTNVRIFIVRLTGEVEEQGIRYANATWRVSDIIDQSGGLKQWANGSAIEIRRKNGAVDLFDFWNYKNYGTLSNNHLLQDGDVIYVPGRDFEKGTVYVQSSPLRSGFYQYLEEETVLDFINRGIFDVDKTLLTRNIGAGRQIDSDLNPIDLDNISVVRSNSNGLKYTINLTLAMDGIGGNFIGNFLLEPGDVLALPVISQFVFVDGEVAARGEIEWVANRPASYYVGIAGRTSDAVKDNKLIVTRQDTGDKIVGEDPVMDPGDHIFVPKKKHLLIAEWLEFISPVVSLIIAGKALAIY